MPAELIGEQAVAADPVKSSEPAPEEANEEQADEAVPEKTSLPTAAEVTD